MSYRVRHVTEYVYSDGVSTSHHELPYFAQRNLPRPASLGDWAFVRRVSLDLVGLLPAPDSLGKFLADSSSDKRARLIESLLGRGCGLCGPLAELLE